MIDWAEFDRAMKAQQARWKRKLDRMEGRIRDKTKTAGMDRRSRLALTLIEDKSAGTWDVRHYTGPQQPRLDQLDREPQR